MEKHKKYTITYSSNSQFEVCELPYIHDAFPQEMPEWWSPEGKGCRHAEVVVAQTIRAV